MILRAEHLTKRFGAVTALNDVSFELHAGEIHALCGENGAGKSTLIKLLAGIHPHGSYTGTIEIGGAEARFHSARDAVNAGIGVIHQELSCIDELSVAENIVLGREPRRWGLFHDPAAALRTASVALSQFAAPIDPAAPASALGVGQKQLVEIAKALSRNPRMLILDEPTAALAAHEVTTLLELLKDLRTRGVGCIYISHRLEEVLQIADRITVLRDGATVATFPAAEASSELIVRHMVGREIRDLFRRPAATRGEALLSVENLSVADASSATRLSAVSFELRAGEVLGIGGLMGAGRSELLMHLFGVWGRRTGGQVRLAGQALPAADPRATLQAGMALVTEDRRRFGVFPGESAAFNLSLSSLPRFSLHGVIDARRERSAIDHWCQSLQIKASPAAVADRLSGGNQQKVVLGRVLMTQPRVVLLDEPTRGIDVGAKLEIYELIGRLAAAGCGVLLVSSELPELIGISDRILMLREGVIGGSFSGVSATPEQLMHAALPLQR